MFCLSANELQSDKQKISWILKYVNLSLNRAKNKFAPSSINSTEKMCTMRRIVNEKRFKDFSVFILVSHLNRRSVIKYQSTQTCKNIEQWAIQNVCVYQLLTKNIYIFYLFIYHLYIACRPLPARQWTDCPFSFYTVKYFVISWLLFQKKQTWSASINFETRSYRCKCFRFSNIEKCVVLLFSSRGL